MTLLFLNLFTYLFLPASIKHNSRTSQEKNYLDLDTFLVIGLDSLGLGEVDLEYHNMMKKNWPKINAHLETKNQFSQINENHRETTVS